MTPDRGKCHYFKDWCLFYLSRRLYLGQPVLSSRRNKPSLLEQQPLNSAGLDLSFGEGGRQLSHHLSSQG